MLLIAVSLTIVSCVTSVWVLGLWAIVRLVQWVLSWLWLWLAAWAPLPTPSWLVLAPEAPPPAVLAVAVETMPAEVLYTGGDSFEDAWLAPMEAPPPPPRPTPAAPRSEATRPRAMFAIMGSSGDTQAISNLFGSSSLDVSMLGDLSGVAIGGGDAAGDAPGSQPSGRGGLGTVGAVGTGKVGGAAGYGGGGSGDTAFVGGAIGLRDPNAPVLRTAPPRAKQVVPAAFDEAALRATDAEALRCIVVVTVDASGAVERAKAQSTCLGQAAVAEAAARATAFVPAEREGAPVEGEVKLRYVWTRD